MNRRIVEHSIPFGAYSTWARVTTTSADVDRPPLIILHGGPGLSHDYCLPMVGIGQDARPIIHYDQLGCGRSSRVKDAPSEFWTVDLFIRELKNLVDYFDCRDGVHILGQSWGGMLGPEYILRYPEGVLSMTISNSPASMFLWSEGTSALLQQLPPDIQDAIRQNEAAGTTESAAYQNAMAVFYHRHLCRIDPFPEDLQARFKHLSDDPTVYFTMVGPSEFAATGSLKTWSIIDRLDRITTPTLVLAGEFDEATPNAWQPFVDRLQNVESHVFPGASHTPHLEKPSEYFHVVAEFLRKHDGL